MSVITRFAPSPTGFLHIGGARTALFNWLFARHHGGKFMLRVEDTDEKRSTNEAISAILNGLSWLGLNWDGPEIYQSERRERHQEAVEILLERGAAYRCYCTPEELEAMRAKAQAEGTPFRYDGAWRDRDPREALTGIAPSIRLKAPRSGQMTVCDLVQGEVTVPNDEIDDLVLLRSDGTPTYMLAVVVDDHDMGITHIIRGDDHLTNTFRQKAIYDALGWELPQIAHIPLIHGPDGAKLSKRHGALGVEAYRDMGYLPEALRNYLLRLGWSHGDDEIISTEQAIEWFNLENIGRSPARFDFAKLNNLNLHYLKEADNSRLVDLILPGAEKKAGRAAAGTEKARLLQGMNGLKERAKTLAELADSAAFYINRPPLDDKARALLEGGGNALLVKLLPALEALQAWEERDIEQAVRVFAEREQIKLGQAAQPLRAVLTGSLASPGIFEVMALLGRDEVMARLR